MYDISPAYSWFFPTCGPGAWNFMKTLTSKSMNFSVVIINIQWLKSVLATNENASINYNVKSEFNVVRKKSSWWHPLCLWL